MQGNFAATQLPGLTEVFTGPDMATKKPLAEALEGYEFVGIYFSAHWCPPCRGFTPMLAQFYEEVNKDGKVFEVIFITSDRDEASFKEYYGMMPWKAAPFECDRGTIKQTHGVQGIPMLPVFKADGTKLVDNGRSDVHQAQAEGKQADLITKWRG